MIQGNVKSSEETRPIDTHVGHKLRVRRKELGLSQNRLAEAIGVTFQQIQKYERGANRVVASRLYDLAAALDVPVSYFFADPPAAALEDSAPARGDSQDHPQHREVLDLVSAYYGIADDRLRKKFVDLVKSVAKSKS